MNRRVLTGYDDEESAMILAQQCDMRGGLEKILRGRFNAIKIESEKIGSEFLYTISEYSEVSVNEVRVYVCVCVHVLLDTGFDAQGSGRCSTTYSRAESKRVSGNTRARRWTVAGVREAVGCANVFESGKKTQMHLSATGGAVFDCCCCCSGLRVQQLQRREAGKRPILLRKIFRAFFYSRSIRNISTGIRNRR